MVKYIAPVLLALALLAGCTSSGAKKSSSSSPEQGDAEQTVVSTTPALGAAGAPLHCGVERWDVKTGTDPLASKVVLSPQPSSIGVLAAMTNPLPAGQPHFPRQAAELQTFTLHTTLTGYKAEADSDMHLVLADGGTTMIAEIPNPGCVKGGPFLSAITQARKDFLAKTKYSPPAAQPQGGNPFVKAHLKVTITGVLFFDFIHGQTGVAKNGVELHPVLSIAFN